MSDLKDLHNAIEQAIADQFGAMLQTVKSYPEAIDENSVQSPAVLIDLEEISEGEDCGDDRTPIDCRFALYCVLSFETPNVGLEIRNFASEVLKLIRRNKWGLGSDVTYPIKIEAMPAEFRPGKHGYESWVVTWNQTLYLGDSIWGDGILPDKVFLGIAPEIGAAYEPKYKEMSDAPV